MLGRSQHCNWKRNSKFKKTSGTRHVGPNPSLQVQLHMHVCHDCKCNAKKQSSRSHLCRSSTETSSPLLFTPTRRVCGPNSTMNPASINFFLGPTETFHVNRCNKGKRQTQPVRPRGNAFPAMGPPGGSVPSCCDRLTTKFNEPECDDLWVHDVGHHACHPNPSSGDTEVQLEDSLTGARKQKHAKELPKPGGFAECHRSREYWNCTPGCFLNFPVSCHHPWDRSRP